MCVCVSLSLSLSNSLVVFFFSSFLSLFVVFFWFLDFVSFFPFLSSLLLFHERHDLKILNCKVLLSSMVSLFGVSCLVFSFEVPFLIFVFFFFFLILIYVFCSTSMSLVSNTPKLKNTNVWSKGGRCNKTVFFCMKLSALQKVKSYRFVGGPFFGANYG